MGVTFLHDGGSSPNQQIVTDADGKAKWEDRTHWVDRGAVECLAETVITLDEEDGSAVFTSPFTNPIVADEAHTVTIDGVEYECVATTVTIDSVDYLFLGNQSALDETLEDTGEPFAIVVIPDALAAEQGIYAMFVALADNVTSLTLSITGVGVVVHPLDKKYFADSIKGQKTINIYLNSDDTATCDTSFDEAWAMDDGELQSALLIHSASGTATYSAFAVGKYDNANMADMIQFSFQTPTDVPPFRVHVYSWYGGEGISAMGKERGCQRILDGSDGGTEFLAWGGSSWGAYGADEYSNIYAPAYHRMKSNTGSDPKYYMVNIDDDRNINLYEGTPGSNEQIDTVLKASDLDADKIVSALGYTPVDVNDVSDAIPDYVRTEAETVARLVNQHQSNDSIVFPFLADAHCGYYTDTTNAATTLAGQLLDLIGQRVPYDFIVHGGDMANGAWDTTRDMSYEQIEDYTELTSDANRGVPAIWVPGNHDDSPYMATADRVTQKEMYALIGRKNRSSGAICPNGCNYGYLDLESQHLRVIYLDTDDKRSWGTVQVGNGEDAPAYLNAHNLSAAQLSFLASTALDFSDKEDPSEWNIVVVSHVALDVSGTITDAVSSTTYTNSTANAATILAAYASGSSGSITHNGVTVAYDYSTLEARASMICCVHGHNHKFSNETLTGGILSIGCPNVMNGRERESSDGNTYTKTAGTADGTSFCILTIDRENSKIYADCVGVGPDREFEYTTEVVAYTNLLPISTDADGAVYNGVGYKADTYLSSGVDGTKTGIYASGYMQGVANEYGNYFFYLKNVGMQTEQDSHRVALYDGTKTYITTVKTTVTGNPFTYGDDGNISQLMFTGESYPDGLYIRICCGYLGDDSIITANEPIE